MGIIMYQIRPPNHSKSAARYTILLIIVALVFFVSCHSLKAQTDCALNWSVNDKVSLINPIDLNVGECTFSSPRQYYDEMPTVSINGLPLARELPAFNIGCTGNLDAWNPGPGGFSYLAGPYPRYCRNYLGNIPPSQKIESYNNVNIGHRTGLVQMTGGYEAEDKVIDYINTNGTIKVQVGSTNDVDKKEFVVPATNCVRIGGADPDAYAKSHNGKQPMKVVFMRGDKWNSSVSDFLSQAQNILDEGFGSIDPLRRYQGEFSFYVDLHKIDQDPLRKDNLFYAYAADSEIDSESSCEGASERVFFFDDPSLYISWASTSSGGKSMIYLNMNDEFSRTKGGIVGRRSSIEHHRYIPQIIVHEISHRIGRLDDEYVLPTIDRPPITGLERNCSIVPASLFRGEDNKMYGALPSKGTAGCGYYYTSAGFTIYRPSPSLSILGDFFDSGVNAASLKFNVISCGYLIAALKGESPTKANAQKYWPECMNMDTIKDGIPPTNPAPTVTGPSPSSSMNIRTNQSTMLAAIGDIWNSIKSWITSTPQQTVYSTSPSARLTLYGNGFTPTDNAVKFTNNSDGKEYEVMEIPSGDGKSITFLVPIDIMSGSYTVKVGAFNSDWSNSLQFIVAAAQTPTLTLSAVPSAVLLGQPVTVSWISSSASSCTGNSDMDKPPAAWSSTGLSGSFSFIPADNTTLSMVCTGPGGTTTKTVNITVGNFSAPAASLKTATNNLTTGQGTIVSWSTSFVSSCTGIGSGDAATLALWNKNQPLTGSLYITPTQNTTLSLICTNNNAVTASSSVSISVVKPVLPPTPDISVTCSTTPRSATTYGKPVTFEAVATGGTGTYQYAWSGDDGLSGSNKTVTFYYYNLSGQKAVVYKNASVTVSSGDKNVTAQCPKITLNNVSNNPVALPLPPSINSISPSSGPVGTTVTLYAPNGSDKSFTHTGQTVSIKNNGNIIHVQPFSSGSALCPEYISNPGFTQHLCSTISFVVPATVSSGSIYDIGVFANGGEGTYESNTVKFTVSSLVPTIDSLVPTSGTLKTVIVVRGNNLKSDSTIILTKGSSTYTVTPTFVPAVGAASAYLTFNLPSSATVGTYFVKVNNQGAQSIPKSFELIDLPPTIQLSASSLSVNFGNPVTISWSTTGASVCKGDGSPYNPPILAWQNPRVPSGTVSFVSANSTTLTLTCTGAGGTISKNVYIRVTAATTPSPSYTTSPSESPSYSYTPSPSYTYTPSPSSYYPSSSPTITTSPSESPSYSSTPTPTQTPTPTPTSTASPSPTYYPSPSESFSPSESPTAKNIDCADLQASIISAIRAILKMVNVND